MIEMSTKYNRYALRIPRAMRGGGGGVVGSLSFDIHSTSYPIWT